MEQQFDRLSQEDFDLSRIEELESLKDWLINKGYPMGSAVAQGVLDNLGCISLKELEALEDKHFEIMNLRLPELCAFIKDVREKSPLAGGNCRSLTGGRSDSGDCRGYQKGNRGNKTSSKPNEIEINATSVTDSTSMANSAVHSPLLTTPHEWIYVIACEHGCFYVGRTRKNPDERFEEHRRGQGSQWTKLHPPIRWQVAPRPPRMTSDVGLEEDVETKVWMKRMGVPFVRGGSYAQPVLSTDHEQALQRELFHDADACTRCGRPGHFVATFGASTRVTGEEIAPHAGSRPSVATERFAADTTERGFGYQDCKRKSNNYHESNFQRAKRKRYGGLGGEAECEECFKDISNSPKGHTLCYQCYSSVSRKVDDEYSGGRLKSGGATSYGKGSSCGSTYKAYPKANKSSSSSSWGAPHESTKSKHASGKTARSSTSHKWNNKRRSDWDF